MQFRQNSSQFVGTFRAAERPSSAFPRGAWERDGNRLPWRRRRRRREPPPARPGPGRRGNQPVGGRRRRRWWRRRWRWRRIRRWQERGWRGRRPGQRRNRRDGSGRRRLWLRTAATPLVETHQVRPQADDVAVLQGCSTGHRLAVQARAQRRVVVLHAIAAVRHAANDQVLRVQVPVHGTKEGQRQVVAAAQDGNGLRKVQLTAGAVAVNDRKPSDAKDDAAPARWPPRSVTPGKQSPRPVPPGPRPSTGDCRCHRRAFRRPDRRWRRR